MIPARPTASREALHFAPQARKVSVAISSPAKVEEAPTSRPMPTGDRLDMLTKACNGDEKCICVNHAIFKHDSGWATAGVGRKANNPGNMRPPKTWSPSVPFTIYYAKGNGQFARFESLRDGVQANVELYFRFYSKYTNADDLVDVWADGGGNASYRNAVRKCF